MLKHFCKTAGLLVTASALTTLRAASPAATTPIQHIVVIFQENNSFDHYFGTYPTATNPGGEPVFTALPNTPSINGITPAVSAINGNNAPYRLDRSQAVTCDQDNAYKAEQSAYNSGAINLFPANASQESAPPTPCPTQPPDVIMGYYDGNTVTALWNYAQYFAISDNFFDTEFGVTEEGHQNLIAGQTNTLTGTSISGDVVNGSIIANVEAGVDACVPAAGNNPVTMTSKNIGDLLTAKNITWGWFYGDFPQSGPAGFAYNGSNYGYTTPITSTQCGTTPSGQKYNSHYAPFMYYASTSNQGHLPPSSTAAIGTSSDQANHNYTLVDFMKALNSGNLPAVTFLKAETSQTGHPSKSDPLSEQTFLVDTINTLQASPLWSQMAIFITYDDSDGWYDHVMPPILNHSNDTASDTLAGSSLNCYGTGTAQQLGGYNDRCGYGTRLPLIAISPYAKQNYVDHAVTDTTSVLRFIEDNWSLGRIPSPGSFDALAGTLDGLFDFTDTPRPGRELTLDPNMGTVVTAH